jgi:hypothetical protein
MDVKFWGLPLPVWGGLCLALAVLFIFLWPANKQVSGVPYLILRWAHALVWMVLAVSCFVRAWIPRSAGTANVLAFLALPVYLIFVFTFISTK